MVLAGPVKRGQIIPRHFWIHVMDHMKTVVLETKRPKSPPSLNHKGVCAFLSLGKMFKRSTHFQKSHRKIAGKTHHPKWHGSLVSTPKITIPAAGR